MNFVKISSFKKAQIVLRINALILFLFIITTPYLVKGGIWNTPEEVVEGLFLTIEIIVLIVLFRNYDFHSNKSDQQVEELNSKLEKQKELSADTWEYLGKMNVQMSIIRQFVKKFKAPAEKDRLDHIINEMLQVVVGLIDSQEIILRIINLDNYKTIKEITATQKGNIKRTVSSISNEKLHRGTAAGDVKNNFHIISSEHDNFLLKTFIMIDRNDKNNKNIDKEQAELIQDIVNQCEIVYLLFNSEYHR